MDKCWQSKIDRRHELIVLVDHNVDNHNVDNLHVEIRIDNPNEQLTCCVLKYESTC
jgi:hypothetical protein